MANGINTEGQLIQIILISSIKMLIIVAGQSHISLL